MGKIDEICASCMYWADQDNWEIKCYFDDKNYINYHPDDRCQKYKKDTNKTAKKVFDIIKLYEQYH